MASKGQMQLKSRSSSSSSADMEERVASLEPMTGTSRAQKVKAIFSQFDKNDDGRLSKDEMAALVVAVNPSVRFSEEQIAAILDEVFRTYGEYIDSGGLSLDGLHRTYDDGAGDVDRDFDALGLSLLSTDDVKVGFKDSANKAVLKGMAVEQGTPKSPSFKDGTDKELTPAVKQLLEELEGKLKEGAAGAITASSLQKVLAEMRHRADTLPSRSPADSYDHALQVARAPLDSKLLPQIHVNLGVALEYDGYLMGACEHYREAAILNPQHHRSLKHLGSALFALGELRAAEEALQHAVNLRPDYADAQVDLGNAQYGLGNKKEAVACFQKAVDLDGKHIEALYNLANVKREADEFDVACKLYDKVLIAIDEVGGAAMDWRWKVQLNRTVCMLALGRGTEYTMKALQEVYVATGKRVELYELKKILVNQQKAGRNLGLSDKMKTLGVSSTFGQPPQARAAGEMATTDAPTALFARANTTTSTPAQVKWALEIRAVQKVTRLGVCLPVALRREASDSNLPDERRGGSGSPGGGSEGKIVRKANVEKIFRRLLDNVTTPETFSQAMKHINQRMLAVLDTDENGTVDLGKVLAVVALLCGAPMEDRKRTAYDILLWRAKKEDGQLPRGHALGYLRDLALVYKPHGAVLPKAQPEAIGDADGISHQEFSAMFEDDTIGFNYLSAMVKMEETDRFRHHGMKCAVMGYNIVGPRYHCTNGNFSLCAASYAEMKLPPGNLEQYIFEEITLENPASKLANMACYSPHSNITLDA